MELTIISPTEQQRFTIRWLELNTPVGNFVIQQGRAPTIVTLFPHHNVIFELQDGTRESLRIHQGIAQITRTSVTLLIHE